MTQFLQHTMSDIRTGRETWRVFTSLGAFAFAIAVLIHAI